MKAKLVFLISYLAYATYYLTRKNLSVVKSRLVDEGISMPMLGTIDALYLSAYAAGLFIMGALGDRFGAKKILVLGLLGSALCSIFFGSLSSALMFALAFFINGFFQSAGWPSGVKVMAPWFLAKSRGKIMGFWSTNYQIGGLLATMFASYFLMHFGWRMAFIGPGIIVAVAALLVWLFLPSININAENHQQSSWRIDYAELLKKPKIWALGFAYFGLKFIRYSFLFWLPFYLHRVLHFKEDTAAFLSLSTEIGGILGAISVGFLADRFMPHDRGRITIPLCLSLALCLFIYLKVGSLGIWPNFMAMAAVGFFLFGPDTLISGACAQDVGGPRLSASAAGFINGLGSIGGISQGFITVFISENFGWDALFYFFILVALLAALVMVPVQLKKPAVA